MEKKDIKLSFDDGRKTISLDKRMIRKAASREAWIKDVLPATKNFGVPQSEIEAKLGEAFDSIRGETEKEAKPVKK